MPWTFERRLLVAAVLAWAAVAVLNLAWGPPLGHDEAAFAIVARGDGPFWLYRSRGVTLLAELGIALGGGDLAMRLASAVLGLGVVLAVYALGRVTFGARSGAWAAAVIAGAHPMVIRNADLLGDLPAVAGVLAGMAVLAGELNRPDGPRWRIVAAAPAFAAAFYARYGSAPVIAIAGLAALILWARVIVRRPLPVLAAGAVFAALLVPHFVHSLRHTGELLGVLRSSSDVPRRAYWGEGLVGYVTSNPFVYYGALVTPVILGAFVGLARRFRARPAWFAALVALGQLIAIGLQTHAQPRYVFVAVALLVVLGVEAWRVLAPPRPRLALALVGAAWLAIAVAIVPYDRLMADARGSLLAAAAAVRADHHAGPCVVFAAVVPQLIWYSGCDGVPLHLLAPDVLAVPRARYMVSTPYGFLDGAVYAASHGLAARELATGDARAHVWLLR